MINFFHQTGDIILFKRKFNLFKPMSWIALIIRIITKAKYNHAGVILVENNQIFLVESWTKGIRKLPFYERNFKDVEFTTFRPNYWNFDKLVFKEEIKLLLKKKYDYKATIIEQFLYYTFGIWTGAKNEEQAKKRLFCYELVWYLHRKSDTFGIWGKWWKCKLNDIITDKYKNFKEI